MSGILLSPLGRINDAKQFALPVIRKTMSRSTPQLSPWPTNTTYSHQSSSSASIAREKEVPLCSKSRMRQTPLSTSSNIYLSRSIISTSRFGHLKKATKPRELWPFAPKKTLLIESRYAANCVHILPHEQKLYSANRDVAYKKICSGLSTA